jgi:HSP20 family protein
VNRERSHIKIYREVPFTSEVTDEGATAQLIDGVLSVTIPKVPKAEKTKIKIE